MYNIYGSMQGSLVSRNKTQRFHRTVEFRWCLGEMDAMRIIAHLSLIMRQRKRGIVQSRRMRESLVEKAVEKKKKTFADPDGPIRRNVFSFGSIPAGRVAISIH